VRVEPGTILQYQYNLRATRRTTTTTIGLIEAYVT